MSMDDIVFQARVEDLTDRFFTTFENRLQTLEKQTQRTFDATAQGSKKAQSSMSNLSRFVGGLIGVFAQMAVGAVSALKGIVSQTVQVAARAETLAVSLANVGANAGYSAAELSKYEENLKDAGITTIQARQQMIRLIGANMDLAQARNLARAAQNLAVVAGTNSSQMFERLTHAILTLNPAILTDIGLNVNLGQAYDRAAKEIGKNEDALDYNTKKQIAMNEVLKKAEPLMGTYEDAMGTAGKQAGSMARQIEELQLAFGNAFLPFYQQWISFLTEQLKEARDWFEENKDAVEDFTRRMGLLAEKTFEVADALIKAFKGLPDFIMRSSKALAALVGNLDDEELDKRASKIGTVVGQIVTLLAMSFAAGVKTITEIAAFAFGFMEVYMRKLGELFRTPPWDWGEVQDKWANSEEMQEVIKRWENIPEAIVQAAADTAAAVGQITGVFEPIAEEAEEVADRVEDAMKQIAEETKSAVDAITALNDKFVKDAEKTAKKFEREVIDRQIRNARRLEDLERKHLKRVDKIYADFQKKRREQGEEEIDERAEVERDHRSELLDIEIEYQRDLMDIKADYNFDLQELVRKNDAVAIVRLMRQTKKRLQEVEIERDRSREDENKDFGEELNDIKRQNAKRRDEMQDDLDERLEMAEQQRKEDLENLNRNLERERIDRERHAQWAEEDRMDSYREELENLGSHLGEMGSLTEGGLRYLMDQHGGAIEWLDIVWTEFYGRQEARAAAAARVNLGWGPSGQGTLWTTDPEEEWPERENWYQRGGMGVATERTNITLGENGPEAFAIMPMQHMVRHSFGDMNINLSGVSPQAEQELLPVVYDAFVQLAQNVAAQRRAS